jgi:hypothetical protein
MSTYAHATKAEYRQSILDLFDATDLADLRKRNILRERAFSNEDPMPISEGV